MNTLWYCDLFVFFLLFWAMRIMLSTHYLIKWIIFVYLPISGLYWYLVYTLCIPLFLQDTVIFGLSYPVCPCLRLAPCYYEEPFLALFCCSSQQLILRVLNAIHTVPIPIHSPIIWVYFSFQAQPGLNWVTSVSKMFFPVIALDKQPTGPSNCLLTCLSTKWCFSSWCSAEVVWKA